MKTETEIKEESIDIDWVTDHYIENKEECIAMFLQAEKDYCYPKEQFIEACKEVANVFPKVKHSLSALLYMLGHLSSAGVEASVAGKKLGEAWSTYSLKQKSSSMVKANNVLRKTCKCTFPTRDADFSICMRCDGQLGSYHQCLNCTHKRVTIPVLNIFRCKQYGWQWISKAKRTPHCAMQSQKYFR